MYKDTLETHAGGRIIGMDSISHVGREDEGQVVLSASHGGKSSGEYGLSVPLRAVFYNDAGVGKDEAGIAALGMLEEKGVPCGTYSHDSARIGDVRDAWENGIVSHLNAPARASGLQEGERVQDALRRITAQA